jgi:hypothetical protein
MTHGDAIARLRAMCGGPRDGALLRVSIANALLAQNDVAAATDELRPEQIKPLAEFKARQRECRQE